MQAKTAIGTHLLNVRDCPLLVLLVLSVAVVRGDEPTPPTPSAGVGHVDEGVQHAWHLSVINGGQPRGRRTAEAAEEAASIAQRIFSRADSAGLGQGRLSLQLGRIVPVRTHTMNFGKLHGLPVTGDFNGDGFTEVGIFCDGQWFIDLNGNGNWDDGDLWAQLGQSGDLPITGDWDQDGKTDIGIFGPQRESAAQAAAAEAGLPHPMNHSTGYYKNVVRRHQGATHGWRTLKPVPQGSYRADPVDHVFLFGAAGDRPLVGDWTGSGAETIGVFRDGRWSLDVDGDGRLGSADLSVELGQAGDLPIAGDFNGDGIDELGVYRRGTWIIDCNGNHRLDADDLTLELGGDNDLPAVGDWDGDGRDQIGIYHRDGSGWQRDGKPDGTFHITSQRPADQG